MRACADLAYIRAVPPHCLQWIFLIPCTQIRFPCISNSDFDVHARMHHRLCIHSNNNDIDCARKCSDLCIHGKHASAFRAYTTQPHHIRGNIVSCAHASTRDRDCIGSIDLFSCCASILAWVPPRRASGGATATAATGGCCSPGADSSHGASIETTFAGSDIR